MTVIRAAISVEKDTQNDITKQAVKLFKEVQKKNPNAEICALFASQTDDLKSYNCCTAIRKAFGTDFALECFQEVHIENQVPKIIRFSIFCSNDFKPVFVYLDKASSLRADLLTSSETSN